MVARGLLADSDSAAALLTTVGLELSLDFNDSGAAELC